jgi:hypothetical protein
MKWLRFAMGMVLVLGLLAVTVDVALRLTDDESTAPATTTTELPATSTTSAAPATTSGLPVRPVNAPLPAPGVGGQSTAATVSATSPATPSTATSSLGGSVAASASDVSADGATLSFQGVRYTCDQPASSAAYRRCTSGGASAGSTVIWCDTGTCLPYDPATYAEVGYHGARYLCRREASNSRWSCGAYAGGPAVPELFTTPAVRCEGTAPTLQCSDLWYPSVLNGYDSFENQGATYLCRAAAASGPDDWDCGPYGGGDPSSSVAFGQLRCTKREGTFTCNALYYPSERDGIQALTIQGETHACTQSAEGLSCYPWTGTGSPKAAIVGTPAWYCNDIGCAKETFPAAAGPTTTS